MLSLSPIDTFIDEQPQVIAASLHSVSTQLGGWPENNPASIVLVGSGSSFNALTVAEAAFGRTAPVKVLGPRAFLRELAALTAMRPHVLVLSQTGISTTSVETAQCALAAGLPTLVLTAAAKSPIAA